MFWAGSSGQPSGQLIGKPVAHVHGGQVVHVDVHGGQAAHVCGGQVAHVRGVVGPLPDSK